MFLSAFHAVNDRARAGRFWNVRPGPYFFLQVIFQRYKFCESHEFHPPVRRP